MVTIKKRFSVFAFAVLVGSGVIAQNASAQVKVNDCLYDLEQGEYESVNNEIDHQRSFAFGNIGCLDYTNGVADPNKYLGLKQRKELVIEEQTYKVDWDGFRGSESRVIFSAISGDKKVCVTYNLTKPGWTWNEGIVTVYDVDTKNTRTFLHCQQY